MTRIQILTLSLCTAALAINTGVADPNDIRLVEEVRCAELAFARAVEQQDWQVFEDFLTDDARFVGAGLLRGPKEILHGWEAFFTGDYPRLIWRPDVVEILADGHLALSRGPYSLIVRDSEGSLIETWGYYNSVWRRTDGDRWKIQFDVGQPRDGDIPPEERDKLETSLTTLMAPCS